MTLRYGDIGAPWRTVLKPLLAWPTTRLPAFLHVEQS